MKKWSILIITIILLSSLNLILVNAAVNISSSLKDMQALDLTLQNKSKQFVDTPIVIPTGLKTLSRFVFGIKPEQKIDLQDFVVLVAIWIALFAIISSLMRIMPFFSKGASRFLGAAVATCLVGVSGAILTISTFFYSFFDIFNWAEKYGIVKLILALIIIGVLIYGSNIILNRVTVSANKQKAEMTGLEVGASAKIQKQQLKAYNP